MKLAFNINNFKAFFFSTLGILILALCINLLSWQFKLVSGGLPGYALTLNYLSGTPVGVSLLIANTVILLLNFLIVGKTAGIKGVYGYVILSVFIELTKGLLNLQQIDLVNFIDKAILIFLQGLIAPLGISFVIVNNYSFGSYSSLIPLVNNFYKISPQLLFLFLDAILTLLITIFLGWEKGLLLLINSTVFYLSFKYSLKFYKKFFK